ncbi:multiprotein-bridging factor 1 family protein [Streptomyces sp. NPDC057148]|uniref:helix-turn-helix domain-containing protein n=1 Tax=unclassified Streptomyces TaxID=2593676 RepID=UPI00363F1653
MSRAPRAQAVLVTVRVCRERFSAGEQAHQHFAAEVARWREVRGMSKKVLGERMGFHPLYVSHMESGSTKPSEDFARRADEHLLPDPHQRGPAPRRARGFQRPLPCAPAALGGIQPHRGLPG